MSTAERLRPPCCSPPFCSIVTATSPVAPGSSRLLLVPGLLAALTAAPVFPVASAVVASTVAVFAAGPESCRRLGAAVSGRRVASRRPSRARLSRQPAPCWRRRSAATSSPPSGPCAVALAAVLVRAPSSAPLVITALGALAVVALFADRLRGHLTLDPATIPAAAAGGWLLLAPGSWAWTGPTRLAAYDQGAARGLAVALAVLVADRAPVEGCRIAAGRTPSPRHPRHLPPPPRSGAVRRIGAPCPAVGIGRVVATCRRSPCGTPTLPKSSRSHAAPGPPPTDPEAPAGQEGPAPVETGAEERTEEEARLGVAPSAGAVPRCSEASPSWRAAPMCMPARRCRKTFPPRRRPSSSTCTASASPVSTGRDPVAVPLAKVPKVLVDAVLSPEDRNFFKHGGIDPVGIVRGYAGPTCATGARCRAARPSPSST